MLRQREMQPELMDDPLLDPQQHCKALQGLQRVNRISATASRLWKEMAVHAADSGSIRVLDIGCGGGDVLVELARCAARDGIAFDGVGCDISATACEHGRELARRSIPNRPGCKLQFLQQDCLREELPGGYDVVMCTLLLHHLQVEEVTALLRRMKIAAGKAVLVDDLIRSVAGFTLAWIGTRALTRSRIVHVDGPRSVRAAFCLEELRAFAISAGMQDARLIPHWPFRCLVHWSRPC